MLRSAMERQFAIIGKVLKQFLQRVAGLREKIPDASLIIAFRNRPKHRYDRIRQG